jgi:hypothetical protein
MKMILRNFAPAVAVMLGITMFFQVGCAGRSRTSRFYVLSPVAVPELEMKNTSGGSSAISIAISPVSLPKYLKKSQIVTRTGSNELHLAEYDRWAGKIEEDIGLVIAENMSRMLATDKVLLYPAMDEITADYTINIAVIRFDGRLGGDVELIARWAVSDGQGNSVYGIRTTHTVEHSNGWGYEDMVGAQSRALAAFSLEMANFITGLPGS